MDKIEIQWRKSPSSTISQIYQSGLQYAFVSDDMKQCFPFVYCKDFLQDAVHAQIRGKTASIYGFSYNPKKNPPLCFDRTRIALANQQDPEMRKKIPAALDFINQFCKKLGLKRTQVFECASPPEKYSSCGVFLFDGSGMWMNSPVLISMYTLLLRVGFAHKDGAGYMSTMNRIVSGKLAGYQNNDQEQLADAISGVKMFLKHGYRKFFFKDTSKNYPAEVDTDTMHESCGIVGFSTGMTNGILPHCHRKSVREYFASKGV